MDLLKPKHVAAVLF